MASVGDTESNMKPIKLYVAATMNGWKIPILLEELKLPYTVHHINFGKKEQKEAWFLKINPNGRIPAIVDPNNGDFAVAESAAILMYLCQRYDPDNKHGLFAPNGSNRYYQITQWLFFQMSGIGPIMGNSMYFNRLAKPKGLLADDFAVKRFEAESVRLLTVLNTQIGQSPGDYIVGGGFSIADICCYPWVKSAFWANVSLEEHEHILKWIALIDQREAVQKGLTVPTENRKFFGEGNKEEIEEAIKKNHEQFNIAKQVGVEPVDAVTTDEVKEDK